MKYFLDTEFLEGPQQKRFLGIPFGKTKPTIDLISIGIVSEDGREYYAISKDFSLKEAWNRYDLAKQTPFEKYHQFPGRKVYWIRENVLKPIYHELHKRYNSWEKCAPLSGLIPEVHDFSYEAMEILINAYGLTNRQIANDVCEFIYGESDDLSGLSSLQLSRMYEISDNSKLPKFYTYYGAYDWVVFCWLFGKMIDLPKGFPMYSNDLKQMLDEKSEAYVTDRLTHPIPSSEWHKDYCINEIKADANYPKQENEHNALDDARWNKKLFEFLQSL